MRARLVIYLIVLLVWKGRLGTEAGRVKVLSRVRVLAVAAASVPVSTSRQPRAVVALPDRDGGRRGRGRGVRRAHRHGTAVRRPWRGLALGPMAFVSAVTMLVLAVDIMTGARLIVIPHGPPARGRWPVLRHGQHDLRPLRDGHHPVVHGGVVVAGAPEPAQGRCHHQWPPSVGARPSSAPCRSGGRRRRTLPRLIPGIIYLVFAVLGFAMTWKRVLLIGGSVVALFFLIGVAGWLRPAASRGHLGRFIQSIVDGNALDVVIRKGEQNLGILLGNAALRPARCLPRWSSSSTCWPGRRPGIRQGRAASWPQAPTLRAS